MVRRDGIILRKVLEEIAVPFCTSMHVSSVQFCNIESVVFRTNWLTIPEKTSIISEKLCLF